MSQCVDIAANDPENAPGRLGRLRLSDEQGQTLVEYGLILLLIVIAAVVAVTFVGNQVTSLYSSITNSF